MWEWQPQILREKIQIYDNYMDRGFGPDDDCKLEDFCEDDDGNATALGEKFMCISKEDYERINLQNP